MPNNYEHTTRRKTHPIGNQYRLVGCAFSNDEETKYWNPITGRPDYNGLLHVLLVAVFCRNFNANIFVF